MARDRLESHVATAPTDAEALELLGIAVVFAFIG